MSDNKKIEKREAFGLHIPGVELRADGDSNTVTGYASVFNSSYEDPYVIEVVRPGAFSRALKEKQDVRALIDHIPTLLLGRTKSNTLRLLEDNRGLFSEINLPNTHYASDLKEKLKRGDLDGMSFGFIVMDERWGTKDGKLYREILDVDLFDVSPVTYPAYQSTSAQLRSRDEILTSGKAHIEASGKMTDEIRDYFAQIEKYLVAIETL